MKKRKNPLSIRIIYWLTQIVFWLFVAVFVGSVLLNIGTQFELFESNMQLHANLTSELKYTEKGTLNIYDRTQEVEFVEATGKIHFINTHPVLAKWFGGVLFGVVIIVLYIFLMFKRFIGNVYRGLIFERFNIQMLKKMAYGLLALWLFTIIYSRLFYCFIAKHIEFEHLVISGEFNNHGIILIVALLLWVLSHIFMMGVKLKEEQKLTV